MDSLFFFSDILCLFLQCRHSPSESLLWPMWFGALTWLGMVREFRKGQWHWRNNRHMHRKAGVCWGVYTLMEWLQQHTNPELQHINTKYICLWWWGCVSQSSEVSIEKQERESCTHRSIICKYLYVDQRKTWPFWAWPGVLCQFPIGTRSWSLTWLIIYILTQDFTHALHIHSRLPLLLLFIYFLW